MPPFHREGNPVTGRLTSLPHLTGKQRVNVRTEAPGQPGTHACGPALASSLWPPFLQEQRRLA